MKNFTFFLVLLISFSSALFAQDSPVESTQASIPLIHNDPGLPVLLKEFHDAARYYKVGYKEQILKIKEVRYIKADLNFLGDISESGEVIYLNEELLNYSNLARIVLFRQYGKLLGLKDDLKKSHAIMGTHWEINLQHELYASHLSERPWHKANFFTALAEKNPIEKRL